MKNLKTLSKKAGLALLLSTVFISPVAFADDISEAQARIEALSYAPEGSNLDERFSQFQLKESEYAEHELNDAWLGMPAYSSDNKLIGYIDDAFIDQDGYISELVIGLNENQGTVEVKGKFAELTDEKVQFDLSNTQIAALAGKNKLASLKD